MSAVIERELIYQPENEMSNSRKWYFVQRPNANETSVVLYASQAHALSSAACRNFDSPTLPPCIVVEVEETGAQFAIAADAQAQLIAA